ncbi:TBC1 domain family member 22B [Tribolium madens]|uniref:TBC1 domain family member 22B n=1 Tax=Tribolium madens TaxID=41895 RepID=UPI001CF74C4A|nr:TBC1 domain family member 22B [Tribolium madens]XP_044256455.1 TBC1 domain family member 22B [Tribolium madens]
MEGSRNPDHDKTSFWKKNSKTVPGRPSPKKDVKSSSKPKMVGATSFQDFQASVSDAWAMDDDDFCIISGLENTKISKKVSQSAALNVLNSHRSSTDTPNSNEKPESGEMEHVRNSRIPGRPQQLHCLHPPQDEDSESKLERFESVLANPPSHQELCKLSWSGIPVKVRAITWRLLSGYLPINLERRNGVLERKRQDYWNLVDKYYYADHDETNRDIQHQINIDVPRMNPSIPLFQQKTVQIMFERILFIWSIRHPASGYVQGINDLVTPFYVVFLQEFILNNQAFETFQVDTLTEEQLRIIEADSFWCLSKFLDGIQDNYVFAQVGIQRKVHRLEELIKRVDETLHRHLKQHNVSYLQFSFRWLNNLLTRELPLRCTIRLWDTYLAENDCFASFQLYVCASFLLYWKDDLMRQNDFQGLLLLLQNLPTQSWTSSQISILVAEAYKLKVMFADAPNHLQSNTGDS